MDGDLKALDAGTMPAAMDKYLALRYEKPATILEYFDAPIVFLNEPSAVREAARGVEFRFGEEFKGLLEEGVLAPGLDAFLRGHRVSAARGGEAACRGVRKFCPHHAGPATGGYRERHRPTACRPGAAR